MPKTVLYSQANRREVLSTGCSSTGVLARSLLIQKQYSVNNRSFGRQYNAKNRLYFIGKLAWSLVGSN